MNTRTPLARPLQPAAPIALQRSVALDIAVVILCAAIVWAPLALGATGEWTRLGLEASVAAAVVMWAAAGRGSSWTLLLPIAILAALLVQVMPLPDSLLVAIAPISAGAWKIALAGTTDGWGPISVDPAATAMAARWLFLGAAVIAAVADLARCRSYRLWLTAAISAAAGLIIAAGLLFPVGREERIMLGFVDLKGPIEWWRTPLPPPVQSGGWAYIETVCAGAQCYTSHLRLVGDAYGSYICCNKFAGAVCLTLPVALASLLFSTRERLPAFVRYGLALAVLVGALWILGVTISSRAGFAALVAGALVLFALCIEYRPVRIAAGIAAAAYAVFILTFVVMMIGQFLSFAAVLPEPLRGKLVVLLSDGRAVAAAGAMRMFRASPVLGTGLATYGDLYPRMMPGTTTQYYAHNDYAQFIAETGLAGAAGLLACGVWLIRKCSAFLRHAAFPDRILEAGPWAAVAAIAVHSAFDWNMHVPANAFLACVVCGLAVASAGFTTPSRSMAGSPSIMRRVAGVALVLTCVTSLVLLARDAWTDAVERELQSAVVADRIAAKDATAGSMAAALTAAIEAGEQAARWAPRAPELHVLLAQANVHLAARRAVSATGIPGTEADYLEAARRHSRAALTASPTIRGLPEPAPTPPKKTSP